LVSHSTDIGCCGFAAVVSRRFASNTAGYGIRPLGGRQQGLRYLMVLPVACFPLDSGKFATESAFGAHLRMLRGKLAPRFDEIAVVAPTLTPADYEKRKSSLAVLSRAEDGISYVPLHPSGEGPLRYWLRRLLPTARTLWRAVGEADLVHAGASHVYAPREILALVFGWLRGKPTICVCDIDERRSPEMNLRSGRWSRGAYLRARFFYDPAFNLQLWLAARFCSLCLYKGEALASDFGRGRPSVRNFVDSAFSAEHLVPRARLEEKLSASADPARSLELVYFGRLTAYKGVDRCIDALARARALGCEKLRFTVIGGGEEAESLESLARERGVAEQVRFLGALPFGPRLFEELYRSDLLLATPLSEDTPRSALDALAAGVPILAFDTYYYRELVRSGAVDTVPWPDVDALAQRLTRHAADRTWLAAAARRGVEFAAANTQEIWLDRRIAWTFELLDARAGSPRPA
jgi:glycosyltransferase involved in cell wall biosynthesis